MLSCFDGCWGEAVVDGLRCEVADAAVAVSGVVPEEELAAEGKGVVEAAEAVRVAGVVLECLEVALREGVVVRDVGTGEALGDAEALKLLAEGEGRHGGASVVVEGELAGLDALAVTGLLDEPGGEGGVLGVGQEPSRHAPREDVQDDVEVEVGPGRRSPELRNVPGPNLVGAGGQQLGFFVGGVTELVAPLPDLAAIVKDAVHRPRRAKVGSLVEQGVENFDRGLVHKFGSMEDIEHSLPLACSKGTRRRRSHRRPRGGHVFPSVEAGPGYPECPARSGGPNPGGRFLDGSHQPFPPFSGGFRGIPRSPAIFF